jgi:dephospho-CoA kinase
VSSDGSAPPILRVGLTGGIASGKSTVSRMLGALGAEIIDADAIAHQALEPGSPAHDRVVARFGRDVLDDHGRIDRKILGARVFADADARRALEAIVHPEVLRQASRRFDDAARSGRRIAVFDAALLVESGFHERLDRLIVVRCSAASQIARLLERGLSEDEARARIAAQAPLERKLTHADVVIDTDGKLDDTRRQVESAWRDLIAEVGEP